MTKYFRAMNSVSKTDGKTLKLGDADWPIGGRCGVFGVVNITPDSFSDGGLF